MTAPTPWKGPLRAFHFFVVDADGKVIADADNPSDMGTAEARADYLVRAANAHEVVEAALRDIAGLDGTSHPEGVLGLLRCATRRARAALAALTTAREETE